jgi:hypothetical protein
MNLGRLQFFGFLLANLGAIAWVHAQENAPSLAQIRDWIRELDSTQFRIRQAASKQLKRAGPSAFGPLAEAATGSSLEVTHRALAILQEGALAKDPVVAVAAKKSLRGLVSGRNEAVANFAKAILTQDLDQIAIVLAHADVKIRRDADFISSFSFDGGECTIDFARLPDSKVLSLHDPLFGTARPLLLKHLAKVDYLNLYQSGLNDDGVRLFEHFPNLKRVPMGMTKVTDAGLVHLKGLTHLEYVGLRGDKVTDAGLVHLRGLTNLTGLYLSETSVTDAGLVHLKDMIRMETLYLAQTAITDKGLVHLYGMSQLHSLHVSGTQVTEEGLAKLRDKCKKLAVQTKDSDR